MCCSGETGMCFWSGTIYPSGTIYLSRLFALQMHPIEGGIHRPRGRKVCLRVTGAQSQCSLAETSETCVAVDVQVDEVDSQPAAQKADTPQV